MLFTDLLTTSVSILQTIPHKYELIMIQETWPVAQKYCRVMYTDLATIISDTDWLRLKKEESSKIKVWLNLSGGGLYKDIYSWRWTLNDIPLKNLTYTNWYPVKLDNYDGK